MPRQFFPLDLYFFEHEKVVGLSDLALRLFLASVAYANRRLTDGYIPRQVVPHLVVIDWQDPQAPTHEQLAKELVEAGLWHGAGDRCKSQMCPAGRPRDGFRIHDFLEHNESSDERESERDKERKRKAAWRARKRAEQEQEDGPAGTGMGHDGTVPPHRSIREVSEKEDQRPPSGGLAPNSGALVPQPVRSARAAQAALGVVDRLKASVDSGRRSWSFSAAVKAEWDALLDDDGNLSAARDFLVWFIAEMRGEQPQKVDWQMAMQKVKRYRARALYGVEQAVTRVHGEEDRMAFWKYVEAVCQQAQARSEGST